MGGHGKQAWGLLSWSPSRLARWGPPCPMEPVPLEPEELGGGGVSTRDRGSDPDLRPRGGPENTDPALLTQKALPRGRAGEASTPSAPAPAPARWGPHPRPQSPTQAGSAPAEVTPTSRAGWGRGSSVSRTLRRLILMACRKRGGRRCGWERSVAMVAGCPALRAAAAGKIVKPQDCAKGRGRPP